MGQAFRMMMLVRVVLLLLVGPWSMTLTAVVWVELSVVLLLPAAVGENDLRGVMMHR